MLHSTEVEIHVWQPRDANEPSATYRFAYLGPIETGHRDNAIYIMSRIQRSFHAATLFDVSVWYGTLEKFIKQVSKRELIPILEKLHAITETPEF